VIVLSLGLFGIIVVVAYWFAREEQKTITMASVHRAGCAYGAGFRCGDR
jgi:hypothetical protein